VTQIEQVKEQARIIASSSLVPKQYHGKPQDCFIALQAANRLGCDPMLFMQQTYVLHGKPAMTAKFQIALANNSPRIRGGIRWNISEKGDYSCEATCAETGEILQGPICNLELAKAENWTKNGKYRTMPDLMLRYRAATMFIALYLPETTMGFQSVEEVQDVQASQTPMTSLPPDLKPEQAAAPPAIEEPKVEDLSEGAREIVDAVLAEDAKVEQKDLI